MKLVAALLFALSLPACLAPSAPRGSEDGALNVYGDMRARVGVEDRSGGPGRERLRMRARLGADYAVDQEVIVGARVVTGDSDDPKSPHVTLGGGFDDYEISLDRLHVTYRPQDISGGFATFGKFFHPFVQNPVFGELVWDADVQPEGIAMGRTYEDFGVLQRPRTVLGAYVLEERGSGTDAYALVGQASGEFQAGSLGTATVAVGGYHYTDPDPGGSTTLVQRGAGNALLDLDSDGLPDAFASDFSLVDSFIALRLPESTFVLSGQWTHNFEARVPDDTAWALGFATGSAARAGDWRVNYQYQDVGQDALFAAFAQDDQLFSSDFTGHLAGINHQLGDRIGLQILLMAAESNAPPGTDSWRLRIDLNVKF